MKKQGYITIKKVMNNDRFYQYVYIRQSVRVEMKVRHNYIYSFGQLPKALETMYKFRDDPSLFPDVLKDYGFDLMDLDEWILTMETGITSTGREMKI